MVKRWLGTVIVAAAVVLLSACGGGGDSPPTTPAPAADLPIGPAGGTVSHASGAAVVVPAGALTTDTTIRVAMDSTGAPALPAALVAAGNTYVVTPHGSEFAEPAEVRIPVGAVALLPNQVLKLAKAQPGGEWEVLDDSSVQGGVLSAKVGSFSYFIPVTVTYLLPIFQAEPLRVTASTLTCGGQLCSPAFATVTATYTVVANNGQLPSNCTGRLLTLQGGVSGSFDASMFSPGTNVPLSGGSVTSTLPVRPGTFYFKVGVRCTGFSLNNYAFSRSVAWPYTPTYPEMAILRAPAQLDVIAGASANLEVIFSGAAAREQPIGSNMFVRPSIVDRAVIEWQRSDDGGTSWRAVAQTLQDEAQSEPDGPGVPWRYWGARHGFIASASDQGALIRAYACYTPPTVAAPPCVRSTPTRLNVVQQGMAPAILEAPRSVLVQTGQTVSFSARAGGLPAPTLQWQTRAANSSGAWSDVSSGTGATSDSFTTPPVLLADNGRQYRVVASNAMGSAESAAVTVSVSDLDVAPVITTQPAALSVTVGSDAALATVARGTEALSYQWRFNGAPITGANNPVLRLPAVTSAQAGSYTITVTNTAGTVTSNAALLAVGAGAPAAAAPVIVTQPVSVAVNTGNTATFAVGVRSTSALAYQWTRNGQPITGATAAVYSIAQAALGDAATYRVQVSNGVGPAIFSDNVTLTVNASAQPTPLALASQPSPQVQAPGGTATFAVATTGSGPITYQWLKNGAVISGASGAVLTFGSVAGSDAGSYAVTVSNGSTTLTSDAASLVVLGMPVITTQPASASVSLGATATFGVAADGSLLRYQWTRNGVAIPGAVGASYTTPALALGDSGAVYAVVVYNGAGVAFSNAAVLTVTPAVAPSATSKFAYVAGNDGTLTAYTIDAVSGGLSIIGSLNVGPSLRAVTVDPSGKFVYATKSTGEVFAFSIDATTGALTAVAGSPYASGSFAIAVAVEPTGRFVYVANYDSNNVSVFAINATTGALAAVGAAVPAGSNPDAITINPSGKFAYVANGTSGDVSAYTINASTGVLTAVAGSPFAAGTDPNGVSVEPSGRFAYVANRGSNDVSVFAVNATTGALTTVGTAVPAGTAPQSVTVDPSGKFAYVANKGSANVSSYAINATSGVLTAVGPAVAAGTDAYSVTVEASGKFAYVTNFGANSVSAYSINAITGALAALTNSPFSAGSQPISIATSGANR